MRAISNSRDGFTMIEIIIVIAILTILAGAAVPMVAREITRARRNTTQTEMVVISEAVLGYLQDTESWPKDLKSLIKDGYVGGGFSTNDAITDAWGSLYSYSTKGDIATIESLGPDRKKGKDDPSLQVSAKPIRRKLTHDEMETIHNALRAYETARGNGEVGDLPAIWVPGKKGKKDEKGALEIVVSEGYLPSEKPYEKDAWGKTYTYAGSPSDRVVSPSL